MTQSQKEFEAWAVTHYGIYNIGSVDGHYSNPLVSHDWFVWQRSRAAMVVELPDVKKCENQFEYQALIERCLDGYGIGVK